MRMGMAIDLERCVGCHTCSITCKIANNVPKGVWWNRVFTDGGETPETSAGVWPNTHIGYIPMSCQHCDNPACVKVCPVGATWKDTETGVVRQDYDKCIGCRMCMAACPYTGVRSFNWEEPKNYLDWAMGDADAPKHQKHTVEKCTFCYQRLSKGQEPACMELCPVRARTFGDLDDPTSLISQKIATRQYKQLLTDRGTKPSVYYLV